MRLAESVRYAVRGLRYVFKNEPNFRLQIIAAVVVIAAIVYFPLKHWEIVVLLLLIVLVLVILLQTRGTGFSATFSSDSSIYRSRRGVEKLLFNFTVGLAVVFVLISIVSASCSAS